MKKTLLYALFLAFSAVLAEEDYTEMTKEERLKLKPKVQHIEQCKEGFPYLGAGDFNLTSENFTKYTKDSEGILVVVTSEACDYCCKFEENFHEVHTDILPNKTLLHGKKIKLARATLDNVPKLADVVHNLPEYLFYFKKNSYIFPHSFPAELIGRTMSKIIKPYEKLKHFQELKDLTENHIPIVKDGQNSNAIKVIGIFHEKDDLDNEINAFKELAKHYSQYLDILFYLITNTAVADQAYSDYGTFWFGELEKSTIVVINRDLQIVKHEATDNLVELIDFIHFEAKPLFEELTVNNQEIFGRMNLPIIIVFLNPDNKKEFEYVVEQCTLAAKEFKGYVPFTWMNNNLHGHKKKVLGIYHDKVPTLAFNLARDPRLFPFPENVEFNSLTIIRFVQDYIANRLQPFVPPSDVSMNVRKHKAHKFLTNTTELGINNFSDIALTEGKDVLVFFFHPQDDQNFENFLRHYDRVSERFKAIKINSVLVCNYDLTIHPPPAVVKDVSSPMLVLIPAYSKKPPFLIYTDTPKALAIMEFVEKHADVRFKLPELAHLPPDLHAEYYKQKKQMDEQKRQRELEEEQKREDAQNEEKNDNEL